MKRLKEYDVFEVSVDDIFFDAEFNCRGAFTPQSVADLAESIDENGLQFPVVIQPYEKPGYKFRLLAGHRRFRAVTVFLKWTVIPATIRHNLTLHQARILNLTENLERKDLNMLEEAKAIGNLYPDGAPLRTIANELKRPTRWVHIRLRLLTLPDEVQTWAAAGMLSAVNLEALLAFKTVEEQLQGCREIVQSKRGKGEIKKKWTRRFNPRKTKAEILRMIEHLFDVSLDGLPTRLLAWVSGRITDEEIEEDIQNAPGYDPGTDTGIGTDNDAQGD
jgi:ParB family chromosome partitioning protein